MLDPAVTWTFSDGQPLSQWYGCVHLLPHKAAGQWLCIDRTTGQLLWRSKLWRANTFCGVDSDMIVASEMRSDGPLTATYGCYGISLTSGKKVWTSHGSGVRGILSQMFDFVPGFANELRDAPLHVENGRVFCRSGRVLDVKTGQLLERLDPRQLQHLRPPRRIDLVFYESTLNNGEAAIPIGSGIILRQLRQVESGNTVLKFIADTEEGENIWTFSTDMPGRKINGNFYSYRLLPPFLYLVVSEAARTMPLPTQRNAAGPNPTYWHFVSVDLHTGRIAQDFSLSDQPMDECRIEDADDHGLLIGRSDRSLAYYKRTA